MKAKPVIFDNNAYVEVEPGRATHVKLKLPTLKPSLLVQSGHFNPGFKQGDSCWCSYFKEHPDENPVFSCFRCHTWINDGRAEFLTDSSHEFAGQTLDLLGLD